MNKLAVFGSRGLLDDRIEKIIKDTILEVSAAEIITAGETEGVCGVARRLCSKIKMPIKLIYYNTEKYAAGAFERRSKEILKESDFILLIHDGVSKGTTHELELIKKMNKPFKYIKVEQLRQDGEKTFAGEVFNGFDDMFKRLNETIAKN